MLLPSLNKAPVALQNCEYYVYMFTASMLDSQSRQLHPSVRPPMSTHK